MSTSLLYHAFGVRGYARMVKQRCGTLIVQCQPGLVPLLSRTPGVDRVIASGESLPEYHVQAPLMSLPDIQEPQQLRHGICGSRYGSTTLLPR